MFFTLFWFWVRGVSPKGLVHNLLMWFFTLGSSKIEVSETYLFDIVITENDHPRYSTRIRVFFTLFAIGCGGGAGANGIGAQPASAFFSLYNSKIEVFETYFFDIVIA